jgi:hypothetical protein
VQVVFLGVVCAGEQVEQSFDLRDGQGDESGVGWWLLIRAVRQDCWWGQGFSSVTARAAMVSTMWRSRAV